MNNEAVVEPVKRWLQTLVIAEGLCPFAQREFDAGRIHYVVVEAEAETDLLMALDTELCRLDTEPEIETTLLIHPCVLQDFGDYNDFLSVAEQLLELGGWSGVYQIASFHPQYQFAGVEADDASNYSNRSPFPMLHLLREDSIERAIQGYPAIEEVPDRNIARMRELGLEHLQAVLAGCSDS